jgi:uncharacterized protein (TIGR02145 family)
MRKLILSNVMLFTVLIITFINCDNKTPVSNDNKNTLTDIDGNVYKIVTIGSQVWMKENLKVTHYRNGDAIPNVADNVEWKNLTTGAYCNYDNEADSVTTGGRLYNWYSVNDGRNISPKGWHVPTDNEWKELEMYLGMSRSEANAEGWRGKDEGGKLKESGTSHWQSPNTGANNESGFSAIPYGFCADSGGFSNIGSNAIFWSSTEISTNVARSRDLSYDFSNVHRDQSIKPYGFSVRLIRDY